jgi:serine/threonine protein phosphatase 1
MKRTFAIGDTHGCLQTLQALLDKIAFTTADELIMLGDYVDRGPDSKGVIDTLRRLKTEGYDIKMLRGNHEFMLTEGYQLEKEDAYRREGNPETLKSFGIKSLKQMPIEYIDFLKNLPNYHLTGNYILVHAGLNFKHETPLQDPIGLLWIRYWYKNIDIDWLCNQIVIHGHTPQTKMQTRTQVKNLKQVPALNIDCGAFMQSQIATGFGHLCAFDLTNRDLYFQPNVEERGIY